jgi:Ca2+-dependent lipid-binding protein
MYSSLDLAVPDFKAKQKQQRQTPSVNNKASPKKTSEVTGKTAKESETTSAASQEKPEKKTNEATEKKNESNGSGTDLDLQLRALQREKEIVSLVILTPLSYNNPHPCLASSRVQ